MAYMRMKVALAVAGVSLLAIALIGSVFFSFTDWPKWMLIFVGGLMVMPLWDTFAGTPAPQQMQEKKKPFLGFDETDPGDPTQDWKGFNGQGDNN